jgi:plastocyanin
MFKHKYLLAALPLSILAGCSQPNTAADATGTTETAGAQAAAGAQAPGSAPAGSTAKEAADKSGQPESAAQAMQAGAHVTRLAFSSEPSTIPVGKPVTWTLKVTDAKTGAPLGGFETEMTKKMHLVVVKRDLSWFNHIHPTLGQNGTFTVQAVLPSAGSYKLYADYTPTGGKQEVPQVEIATDGQAPAPVEASLTPDKAQGAWLLKNLSSHPEGQPDAGGGAKYQVAMMPMPTPLKAGQASMLHFQIRDARGKPISDLQPYLGAMGHCVILSQDTSKYLHSHPMAAGAEHDMSKMGGMDMSKMDQAPAPKSGGPDVMFHTNFPQPGLYKAWGQFKHRGQIITAPFVLNVGAGAPAAASSAAAVDESKPHTH